MVAAHSVRTLEEFLRLPEEKPALEYFEGRITQKVSPQPQHGVIQLGFGWMIREFVSPRKLGVVITELRSTHHDTSLVPDIAFCREDRIVRNERGEVTNTYTPPPDLAIEVLSPDQSRRALINKCQWFVDNGTEIALLVDSGRRAVYRFAAGQEMVILRGDDRIDLDAVLPGFEVTPNRIFGLLLG